MPRKQSLVADLKAGKNCAYEAAMVIEDLRTRLSDTLLERDSIERGRAECLAYTQKLEAEIRGLSVGQSSA